MHPVSKDPRTKLEKEQGNRRDCSVAKEKEEKIENAFYDLKDHTGEVKLPMEVNLVAR